MGEAKNPRLLVQDPLSVAVSWCKLAGGLDSRIEDAEKKCDKEAGLQGSFNYSLTFHDQTEKGGVGHAHPGWLCRPF